MFNIDEYILQSRDKRQEHLNLDEPCIERGGVSTHFKGMLAHALNTTIPSGSKILVCHACHNARCSNPNHLYWGTPSENALDARANGKKTAWEYTVEKYGEQVARSMQSDNIRSGHGAGRSHTPSHKANISKSVRSTHAFRKAAGLRKGDQSGKNNSQFGTCWITNGTTNLKISKEAEIPAGWSKGRTLKTILNTGE